MIPRKVQRVKLGSDEGNCAMFMVRSNERLCVCQVQGCGRLAMRVSQPGSEGKCRVRHAIVYDSDIYFDHGRDEQIGEGGGGGGSGRVSGVCNRVPPFPGGYTYEFVAEANDQAMSSELIADFALLSFYKAEDNVQSVQGCHCRERHLDDKAYILFGVPASQGATAA